MPSPWCETVTFIDPAGDEYVLSSQVDHDTLEGISGRGMPPIRIADEVVPLAPGSRIRSVSHGVRDVAVPIVFTAASLPEVRDILRGVMRTFDPVRGDGTLRVLTPDGVERDLTCRYAGGFEIVESSPDRGVSAYQAAQQGVLVFRAFDPYWYDVDSFTATYTPEQSEGSFFPIPNPVTGSFVTLVASEVFATVTITLDADVDAYSWPIWTIHGPGEQIVLDNLDTGQSIDLSAGGGLVLGEDDVLVIDTRPGAKTLTLTSADVESNALPYLTNSSSLWALGPEQEVRIQVTGGGDATVVDLEVRAAHLTV